MELPLPSPSPFSLSTLGEGGGDALVMPSPGTLSPSHLRVHQFHTAANGAFLPLSFFCCQELALIISVPSRGNTKQNLHRTLVLAALASLHPLLQLLFWGAGRRDGWRSGDNPPPCRWVGKELTQKPQKRILGARRGGTGVGKRRGAWQTLITHGIQEPPSRPRAVPGSHPALTVHFSPFLMKRRSFSD